MPASKVRRKKRLSTKKMIGKLYAEPGEKDGTFITRVSKPQILGKLLEVYILAPRDQDLVEKLRNEAEEVMKDKNLDKFMEIQDRIASIKPKWVKVLGRVIDCFKEPNPTTRKQKFITVIKI